MITTTTTGAGHQVTPTIGEIFGILIKLNQDKGKKIF